MTSSKIDLLSSSLNHTVHYTVAHIVSNDKFYFMIDFFSKKWGVVLLKKIAIIQQNGMRKLNAAVQEW